MNNKMKKKLDKRLVSGEITPEEYQKILKTLESAFEGTASIETLTNDIEHSYATKDKIISAMATSNVESDATSSSYNKSFLKKLKGGDFGLAKTCWVYGIIVGLIGSVLIKFVLLTMGIGGLSVATPIFVILVIYIAFFFAPGLWKSAERYNGPKIWAILGKIVSVIFAVLSATSVIGWLAMLEQAKIL